MGNRDWRKLAFALLCPALILFVGSVPADIQAASLEKIEVASLLDEPFYAEVPLKLEANELASKVFVEIAAPSDYKIFEVYRDPILKAIRADVASDKRGVRVELSSRSRIKSPFFNLVLKIRYGRVSHFKKFPVFLDAAKSISQASAKALQPYVAAIKQPAAKTPRISLTKSAGQIFMPEASTVPVASVKPETKYYEGWARTDRYGPIVRGDTLSTVAERLRVDYRYTLNQIMMAMFEKNSSSFDQNNINLLKAGSRLKVPTAAEVEKHNKAEANRFFARQEQDWKKLTQQPRYAAE
ncbi:MAG: FimV/HubP family polar landmark protein, partial [Mariprofundus sp.]|nr:FimV/HubP family polar landmark protein [Mariprofundus sp.]